MSEECEQAKVKRSEHDSFERAAEDTKVGSVVERILLSQPLNPLRKCEFEIMPRSVE